MKGRSGDNLAAFQVHALRPCGPAASRAKNSDQDDTLAAATHCVSQYGEYTATRTHTVPAVSTERAARSWA